MAKICLTFDNGPHPVGTPKVLDSLARFGISSTFFVVGKQLAQPEGLELASRIRDAGHRLGNHTYSHRTPIGLDARPRVIEEEIVRTEALLSRIWAGPRFFRPFGEGGRLGPHLLTREAVDWLCHHRYTCVLWNSVPGDFRDPVGWVHRGLEDCEAQDDVLMVLHDVAIEAMERLDGFLEALMVRGHSFVHEFPAGYLAIIEGVLQPSIQICSSDEEP